MANEFVARNGLIAQSNSAITGSLTQGAAGNIASGIHSHAEGTTTIASGPYAHAEGFTTTATGDYSHAEGQFTTALGRGSHAEGQYAYTTGDYSHAEGISTQALGYISHAEGRSTVASGLGSHAEGGYTYALGDYSHTEGQYNTALGFGSHAEGYYTYATGDYSHAEGMYTSASGNFSHAEGLYNIALADYQHVQGQFNSTSSISSAFIVGNGTSTGSRSNLIFAAGNAVEVSGSLRVSGSITGSLFGTASQSVSSSYALTASYALTSDGGGSPFPYTGDAQITGSLTVSVAGISGSNENTLTLGPPPSGGTGEGGQILLAASGGLYTSASMFDNYQNRARLLRGTNAGSDAEVASWNMHTRQMALTAYNNLSAFPGTAVASLTVDSGGNILTGDYPSSWTEYSGSSVIVGWGSYTDKNIRYTTIGKLAHVEYFIRGTGNTGTTTFTLPFSASGNVVTQSNAMQTFVGATTPIGMAFMTSGSNKVTCAQFTTATAQTTSWGASGTKGVRGLLTIEIE